MVTVIPDKEELITPVHNGVHVASNDTERPFQYIKDYQEVNFHRSSSCKPLPEDFFEKTEQSSIKGTYFLQIDAFEPCNTSSNSISSPIDQSSSLLLTLTDGILTVQGITIEPVPELNLNLRPGCKLLLTGVIPIKNGLLQLSSGNTRFQYGSDTYPRPKSAHRGRGGGSYRVSYEGRRGGAGTRPPPKTTLMDFMTSFKITATPESTDNPKSKDRHEPKRRNTEQYQPSNSESEATSNHLDAIDQTTNSSEQTTFQQDAISDQVDSEDDPTHSNYRERRNPLPPRLQRAQEERTRRNTVRNHDETSSLPTNESNGNFRNGTSTNQSSSSSSSYSRRGDHTSFIPNSSSTVNPYLPHGNILTTVNGSGQTHLAYFPANPGPLIYNLAGISSPPFGNPSSYPTDPLAFCYGAPYATPAYLPASLNNGYNGDSKTNLTRPNVPNSSSVEENETKSSSESQHDETHDHENKSQVSSSASSNDGVGHAQQSVSEQNENKRRDSNANPRPRWKVGDVCLARWSEDREFYVATVVQIHPPTCTVQFRDYHNYEQVHFSDLKLLPRDPPYYSYVTPSSDLNPLAASAYFPPRPAYYPSPIDGCIVMPEAPPFPFNSAGTLYMYPPAMAAVQRSNRYSTSSSSHFTRRQENGLANHPTNETTVNSPSTASKDSSTISVEDQQQQAKDDEEDHSLLTEDMEPSSVSDAPMILVKENDEREGSTSNSADQEQTTDRKSSE